MAKKPPTTKRGPKVSKPSSDQRPNDPLTGLPAPTVPSMLGVQEQWNGENEGHSSSDVVKRITIGNETGVPGIKHWFGRLYEEWLPALADDKGRRTFVEMAWNEPTVFSFRYAIEMLVRQVQFEFEPADDTPEEIEWAQFCDSCLHDLDVPWAAVVSDALTMLIYGFALQEMVFKLRKGRDGETPSMHNDGRIGLAKLAPRHQETIWRWDLDPHGKVNGVVQWAPPAWQFTYIPIELLLHYKTHEWHGSPEGLSILRGAYVPFQFKKTIQTLEAIAIERDGCGMPVVRMPAERMRLAGDPSSPEGREAAVEKANLEKLVRDIKTDQQQGLVFPSEFDHNGNQLYSVELISSAGGRTVATDTTIRRYKEEIYSAVIADFLAFGHETTGTQALGSTRNELFLTAVNALVDCVTGPINRQMVPMLAELNGHKPVGPRPGKPISSAYPVLGHSDLQEANLTVLTPYLGALAALGIDLSDDITSRHLRRIADLPVPEIEGAR